MTVSPLVAYRVYQIDSKKKAIAFNTLSKKFMFLEELSAELLQLLLDGDSKRLQEWLSRNELTHDDVHGFIRKLCEFGFMDEIPKPTDDIDAQLKLHEEELLEQRTELNLFQNDLRKSNRYYSFHIDLTNRCNEKCIHCYHPFDLYDYSKELTTAEVKSLVDMIYELGVFSVTLSGGECLLRPDFFEILSYISDKGMMSVIFTNGMLLTEGVVRKIREHRVKLVSISLYGDTPELHDSITTVKGSYEKTLAGIALLKKYRIPFELKCIVLKENVDRVEEIRILSKHLNDGRDCKIDFSLCGKIDGDCSPFSHRATSEQIKAVFYSDPERYFGASTLQKRMPDEPPCGAGKFGLYCDARGDIYPCVSFRQLLCHYTDLPHIASNHILQQWLDTRISDFSDCFKHDFCEYCTEQCAGNNLIENGDFLDSRSISNCDRARIIAEWFNHHADSDNQK